LREEKANTGTKMIEFGKEIRHMLEGKHIAILVEEDFEDSELMEPLRAMKDAGCQSGNGRQRLEEKL
jgi:hypothetical protein